MPVTVVYLSRADGLIKMGSQRRVSAISSPISLLAILAPRSSFFIPASAETLSKCLKVSTGAPPTVVRSRTVVIVRPPKGELSAYALVLSNNLTRPFVHPDNRAEHASRCLPREVERGRRREERHDY